jgi:pSer/pThr/pTyr-binding forkhead associated (FHA) protein
MAGQAPTGVVYTLRIVSGRYQGGMCPLKPGRETVIGRQSDLDLVLAEDLVSRKHARIAVQDGKVTLVDLGSTNGTFVNGRRVTEARLVEGDRIGIGGSLIVLLRAEPGSEKKTDVRLLEGLRAAEAGPSREPSGMRGRLEDVPLPDLLQLLGNGRKTGLLVLRDQARAAQIVMRDGRIGRCLIGGQGAERSRKNLFRLLSWEAGEFEFTPSAGEPWEDQLQEPLDALLLDGLRQLDELRALETPWSSADARLAAVGPPGESLPPLPPAELDLFRWASGGATVQSLLDRSPSTDLEAVRTLLALIERWYLRPL